MKQYGPRYAALYDELYYDKDAEEETRFIDGRLVAIQGGRGSLLDVACGTGRHSLGFAASGWDVVGVDLSEAMLEVARGKASSLPLRLEFLRQDMKTLDVGRTFDAATCLFYSIGYAGDQEGVRSALQRIARHLRTDGVVALEFLHAPAMLVKHDPVRVKRVAIEGAKIVRISETHIRSPEQLAEIHYEVLVLKADGTFESFTEVQVCRYFHQMEMAGYLSDARLEPIEWHGGYGAPLSTDSFHLVVLARRA